MTGSRITLLGSQHDALTQFLSGHPDGHERAAIVLFRRLHIPVVGLPDSDRYLAVEVVPFEDSWVTGSSSSHIAFELAPLRELFRRCEDENLVLGFIHNHPTGLSAFSEIDGENELTLLTALRNRNGPNVTFISMLWADGQWHARVRHPAAPERTEPVRHILVVTDRLSLYGHKENSTEHSDALERQRAAFGQPFVDMLQSLRVGIVGCGGTGSPLATLAARAGVGELVLIDHDKLERSNLNRVRGLTAEDVGEVKSLRLKAFIDSIGVPVNVVAYPALVDSDPATLDAIASCDVVFGCTDDFIGRQALNTALYVYAQLLIDTGLGGSIGEGVDSHPFLRSHFGRISTIFPESGQCLFCQDVVREIWVRTQQARRENPNLTAEQMKERYLEDGGTDAPGVGPFTSASADFALATLFDVVKPFRKFPPEVRRDMFIIDYVTMQIRSYETEETPDCPYCGQHDYLLLKEQYRLNQPFLGKRDAYT